MERRQISIRDLILWTGFAAVIAAGCRNAWPDWVGLVYVFLFTALLASTTLQVIRLVRRVDLPFDVEDGRGTRWVWIGIRSIGVLLLAYSLVDPFQMGTRWLCAPFESDETQVPYDYSFIYSRLIWQSTHDAMALMGFFFSTIPIWRVRRSPAANFKLMRRTGQVLSASFLLLFIIGLVFVSVTGQQSLWGIFFVMVENMDFAQHRNSNDLMTATWESAAARKAVYDQSLMAFLASIGAFLSLIGIHRGRGLVKFAAWITWPLFLAAVFGCTAWIYVRGAPYLAPSWKYAVSAPNLTGLIGGLVATTASAVLVGFYIPTMKRETEVKINADALHRFLPPIWICLVVTVGLMVEVSQFRLFYPSASAHKSFLQAVESGFPIVVILTVALVTTHTMRLKMAIRNGNAPQLTTLRISPINFVFVCITAGVTLLVLSLGVGWFGFALVIHGDHNLVDSVWRFFGTLEEIIYFQYEYPLVLPATLTILFLILFARLKWGAKRRNNKRE